MKVIPPGPGAGEPARGPGGGNEGSYFTVTVTSIGVVVIESSA